MIPAGQSPPYSDTANVFAGSELPPCHGTQSGELLYHYEAAQSRDGCAAIVGEEPECDEYGEDECDWDDSCFECLSGCAANQGCLYPGEAYTSCEARAAAVCGSGGAAGEGGAGGEGGLGGSAPCGQPAEADALGVTPAARPHKETRPDC